MLSHLYSVSTCNLNLVCLDGGYAKRVDLLGWEIHPRMMEAGVGGGRDMREPSPTGGIGDWGSR